MKVLILLLFTCSFALGQSTSYLPQPSASGTIAYINYKPSETVITTCIALQFSPTMDTSSIVDKKLFIKAYLTVEELDYYSRIAWRSMPPCEKRVDVRAFGKDYTFKEFRKLIYE